MNETKEFVCKCCGIIINYNKYYLNSVVNHIKSHGLTTQEYYDKYFGKQYCPICSKETKFVNIVKGYQIYCSYRCAGIKPDKVVKEKLPYVNPFSKTEVQEKIKQQNIEKYNVEHSTQRQDVIEKIRETRYKHTIEKYQKILNEKYNIIFTAHDGYESSFICNDCGNKFKMNFNSFKTRLIRDNNNPCPFCKPMCQKSSEKERTLYELIRENFKGTILKNNYDILGGKEIDIYLPELKLGFEFDGTYWHADPRFYVATDIIEHKHVTAQEIWDRMNTKDTMCIQKDITLIHVKEYDWDHDKNIKEKIINIIKQYEDF